MKLTRRDLIRGLAGLPFVGVLGGLVASNSDWWNVVTSVNDSGRGNLRRRVTIHYLDADYAMHEETLTLHTEKPARRIFRIIVK